jgi:tRNA(Arg) A34 adenosine deaminase TadA
MCLGAIYWAHLDKMYFANTKADAQNAGFDDSFIYEEINLKPEDRKLKSQQLLREEALAAFETWKNTTNKTEY